MKKPSKSNILIQKFMLYKNKRAVKIMINHLNALNVERMEHDHVECKIIVCTFTVNVLQFIAV